MDNPTLRYTGVRIYWGSKWKYYSRYIVFAVAKQVKNDDSAAAV